MEKIDFRKIRDFGELINVTFDFIRQNFKKLFLSMLLIAGPAIFVTGVTSGLYQSNVFSLLNPDLNTFSVSLVLFYLSAFVTYQLIIAVIYSYINLYLDSEGDFDVNDVWNNVKKNIWMIVFTSIGVFFAVMLGLLLLIIPGIYLSVALTLIFIVRMREKLTFFESISRCRYLIAGNWWFTFALLLILAVIQYFFTFIFYIPQYVGIFIGFLHTTNGEPGISSIFMIITSLISSISYFFYAIAIIGISFHYYSLIEKKEAVGLLKKLDSIKA